MITPQRGECLSPEMIAAWVDGRLSSTERRIAFEHTDQCHDCLHVLADTMRATAEIDPAKYIKQVIEVNRKD